VGLRARLATNFTNFGTLLITDHSLLSGIQAGENVVPHPDGRVRDGASVTER